MYNIDKTDRKILSFLVQDGKIPYTEIAKKLEVSHGTIHQRVKKLERSGVIQKTSIVIDYRKLGYKLICYVGIQVSNGQYIDSICIQLKNIPQITVAHITTGQFNIQCKIRCMDTEHAKNIIQRIHSLKGVMRTESSVSFDEIINSKDQLIQEVLLKKYDDRVSG